MPSIEQCKKWDQGWNSRPEISTKCPTFPKKSHFTLYRLIIFLNAHPAHSSSPRLIRTTHTVCKGSSLYSVTNLTLLESLQLTLTHKKVLGKLCHSPGWRALLRPHACAVVVPSPVSVWLTAGGWMDGQCFFWNRLPFTPF